MLNMVGLAFISFVSPFFHRDVWFQTKTKNGISLGNHGIKFQMFNMDNYMLVDTLVNTILLYE